MKRKLLNAALLLFLCTLWLYRCDFRPDDPYHVAACIASLLCLILIPHRIAAAAAAAAVTVTAGVFFSDHFVAFAPAAFACAALFAAASGKAPFLKDGLLLLTLGAGAVCTGVSLYVTLVSRKTLSFMHPALERYHICAAFCAAAAAVLAVCALVLYLKRRSSRKGPETALYPGLSAASVLMLAAFTAAGLCYLKDASCGEVSLLPVVTGAFAALTEGAYAMLPKQEQAS